MKLSKKDYDDILTALNMLAADVWDRGSYGKRPDWEKLIKKIEFLKEKKDA